MSGTCAVDCWICSAVLNPAAETIYYDRDAVRPICRECVDDAVAGLEILARHNVTGCTKSPSIPDNQPSAF